MKRSRFFDAFCSVAALFFSWMVNHDALPHCVQLGFCDMRVADKIALGIGATLAIVGLVFIVRAGLPVHHREALSHWFTLW